MTGTHRAEDPVRRWLSQEETQKLIRKAAQSILRIAKEKRLGFDFIGLDPTPSLSEDAILEDLCSEINRFILENKRGIQKKILVTGERAGLVLRQGFIQEWIDATRSPESDLWRYLYKRITQAIRESPDFKTKTRRTGLSTGTLYSVTPNNVFMQEPSDEDLSSIPFPEALVPSRTYEALNKSGRLLALAADFWRKISTQWGGKPLWVPVKTLVNWMALHVPISSGPRVERNTRESDLLERIADERPGLEALYFDRQQVIRWAGNFAQTLSDDERALWGLHYVEGLTLSEVARRLGYSGPSGAAYQRDKAMDKLKGFLRDLPWLAPPDLNQEACALFTETLLSTLKNCGFKP